MYFITNSELKRHERKHTGIYLYHIVVVVVVVVVHKSGL